MASQLVYLVLYLYLHACSARPLTVWDKATVTKDANTSVAAAGENTSDHGTNVPQINHPKPSIAKEAETIEGEHIKTSYSWKILLRATGTKIWKRAERSTLESPPRNAEEKVSSKDGDSVEDIVVMDYALPHRKPPIHNRGT